MPSPADQVFGPADQQTWTAVDEYVSDLLSPHDEALEQAIAGAVDAGLPAIQVSPPQGKLLALLARSIGARTALEFGTLGGYSTIWIGRALPDDGRVITLESEPAYAEVARLALERADLAERVEVRVGAALESLPALEEESAGPFDLVFIDADKANTPAYFAWSLEHTRPGGLIVADNVIRGGALVDEADADPAIVAQRRFHEVLAAEQRGEATTIQTVGGKGYDGFSIALVKR
jgi:predicted O-methyltransferase YrrM